ncbi:PREDICTED: ras-related and estrogen-regulated growth inhibitor-like isoform X2 [Atta colombica]|uniref:ras-related and estrogen-regulated growth inhibitor-like isoform X2 n=1 Tax=Atta colombica TaxID=520822 RepID=UPI00084BEB48|nr:PREDICTED: ras-related and estrogen-regulated growth inhibitor-like isoform X2 [Atta colombica]
MTNVNRIKVVVLGGPRVGKSAVVVRYLTRRYIGEYSSTSDFLYRHSVTIDNVTTEVEILDTSRCEENGCLYSHIRWGEAFVVVYSVTCKRSFQEARGLLKQLADLRLPSYFTALLLGNKRDLDHARMRGRRPTVIAGARMSILRGERRGESRGSGVSFSSAPAGGEIGPTSASVADPQKTGRTLSLESPRDNLR